MNRQKVVVNYFFFFFLFLCLLFLIFPTTKFVKAFKVLSSYILYPEFSILVKQKNLLKDIPSNIYNLIKADLKNRELEENIKRLKIENDRLRRAIYEIKNSESNSYLSLKLPYRGIFARVISKDPVNKYNSFFIDKGKKHFMKENYPVLAFENGKYALIGKIFEVYEDYSKVVLITDMRLSFIGFIEDKKINFLVKGQNSLDVSIDYIDYNEIVKIGDIVKTSPSSVIFPPYLPVGIIKEVYREKTAMNFYSALMEPLIRLEKVEEVFILEYENKMLKDIE